MTLRLVAFNFFERKLKNIYIFIFFAMRRHFKATTYVDYVVDVLCVLGAVDPLCEEEGAPPRLLPGDQAPRVQR